MLLDVFPTDAYTLAFWCAKRDWQWGWECSQREQEAVGLGGGLKDIEVLGQALRSADDMVFVLGLSAGCVCVLDAYWEINNACEGRRKVSENAGE